MGELLNRILSTHQKYLLNKRHLIDERTVTLCKAGMSHEAGWVAPDNAYRGWVRRETIFTATKFYLGWVRE